MKLKQEISEILEVSKETTLGEAVNLITKGTTPTTMGFSFEEKGINFIKSESLDYEGKIDESKFVKISEEAHKRLSRSQIQKDDILLSMAGAYLGKSALVDERILPANTNQAVAIIRPNKNIVFPMFLSMLLRTKKVLNYINSIPGQSAQPNINFQELRSIPLVLPNMDDQRKIAKILSDLDKKIELNRQMNKNFESIAQVLFKQWFVDFEFPGYEKTIFVDGFPDRWQIKEIKDCGEIVCGKTPPTKDKKNYGPGVFFITIPDMRDQVFVIKTERTLSREGAKLQKNKTIPSLSVCVSCIATPGLVSLTSEIGQTNQQINSIICEKDISPYFMYLTMVAKSDEIKTMGLGGTATLNLNTGNFAKIKVVIPDSSIMNQFHKIVVPFFEKLLSNAQENYNLSNIRDSLLQKLMNGEIYDKSS